MWKDCLPIFNADGSSTAIVPSSTFLNMLACNPTSRKVKYLKPIPDPDSSLFISLNPDKSIKNKK